MAQSVNLSVTGIYTSGSDYNGLPPGALDAAENLESKFKNTLGPRRGFDGLEGSAITDEAIIRGINFYVSGTDRVLALTDEGKCFYYNASLLPATPWVSVPGNSTGIIAPNAIQGKSRFLRAGQNLYLTSQEGIRSLSSGTSAQMIRAGVPKGLNLSAVTNAAASGFFNNNEVLATTGNITSGSAIITHLDDSTGITVDQYAFASTIPVGTKVSSITPEAIVIAQSGNTTAGSTSIANLASGAGIIAGLLVSGNGIPEGAKVASISGTGPYAVVIDQSAYQTATATVITFTAPLSVTLNANAGSTIAATPISFYSGAQVGYRMVFGRVETDINGGTITRLGAPSSIAIANNISATSTNVSVTGTIPKNADDGQITFVQLYRSPQTAGISISPLDQYNLVYEAQVTPSNFTARVITITDSVPDSLVGIPLYAGSDREGILQANSPPPMAWDVCKFRDFALYANITKPSTLEFTVVSVGAPSGVQVNDVITLSGTFAGTPFSRTYTGKSSENQASRQFHVVTGGTPSQNITDTVDSLIRVINYDESCPVHAILISTTTDLPGQILLEFDYPSLDTFTITASAHTTAYDPTLSNVVSEVNTINNGIGVSKTGELEAVPSTNLLYAGDSSSAILRVIPLRDYVVVLKTDGIYKIQGLTPQSLTSNPWDLTTKIIGADTAVSLNSGVWMFSNQGVVSISDGGVDAKSIPIDDTLNALIGTSLDQVTNLSFAVGYESDRKYVLSLPDNEESESTETQYVYNYITNSWTTWTRNLVTGFIHSVEDRIYISRADGEGLNGLSRERKSGTFRDFVDESIDKTVTSVAGDTLTLDNVAGVSVGDILFVSSTVFSPILTVNIETNEITVESAAIWTTGAVKVFIAFRCRVTWKQVFGDNPAFVRQFSEGIALFKSSRFQTATLSFVTDFSSNSESTEVYGVGQGLWGLFSWGEIPWGGVSFPKNLRFYIPQAKQLGSYIIPTLTIRQGYSDFKLMGLSISHYPVSQEVGLGQ